VEAAGIEPASLGKHPLETKGQDLSKVGQIGSQLGHQQEVKEKQSDEERTQPTPANTPRGLIGNTTSAQQKLDVSTTGMPLSQDLTLIIEHWPSLPDPVRAGILAIVKAVDRT